MMSSDLKIGFIGAGKMASALAKGFVRAGVVSAEKVIASDPQSAARTGFSQMVGSRCTAMNAEVTSFAGVLIVAVKPDQVEDVLREVKAQVTERHLLISIAAGATLARSNAS